MLHHGGGLVVSADEIVKYGDEVLRNPTKLVDEINGEVKDLIQHMYEVMHENNGVGLSANQIGVSKRLFVYDVGEGPKAVINPKLEERAGEQLGYEGCLSVPGLQGEVPRSDTVVVEGLDEDGNPVRITAEGFLARVFQHEIDHLDGFFFIDRADPDSLEFVTPEEAVEEE